LEEGGIVYQINQPVYPELGNGPLAVFRNLKGVRRFLQMMTTKKYVVYFCRYIPSEEKELWMMAKSGVRFGRTIFPKDTVLADEVVLLGGGI
jgi:hypothetical protein